MNDLFKLFDRLRECLKFHFFKMTSKDYLVIIYNLTSV